MLFFYSTSQQAEPLHLAAVDGAGFHGVNARGVNTRMAENVREADHVLLYRIERPREQVSEIMREHLVLRYSRTLAKRL